MVLRFYLLYVREKKNFSDNCRSSFLCRGSEILSLSRTECITRGSSVRPGGRSRLWSSAVKWPNLVVLSAADSGEASPGSRKGFGSPKKVVKPAPKKGGSSKRYQEEKGVVLNNAARTADREGATQLSKVIDVMDKKVSGHKVSQLHVDPDEAKKGKVDFVRVQTWGEDEESGKLENLRVKTSDKMSGPFYEKLRAVFQALTDVIARIKKERCGDEGAVALGGAARAVSLFAEDLGLDRCTALNADINSFQESLNGRGHSSGAFTVSTQAASYSKYIRQLGSSSLEYGTKARDACLKLLAHVFTNYVSHLTTGTRIGAKAMDNIVEGKDPLKIFIQTINSAGRCLGSDEDHEQVMDELPKAMQRTSLLLSVLAVEEQAVEVNE
ncbi:hypothetical protein R1sor_019736 [Riccia sorocarpa]|uniref:Uncharacterized protein n=1 Tax=Riccia sorocarpa TaxID=122646 RepID=A0ABD3IGN8_9MARC